jgi:hypothetical protein
MDENSHILFMGILMIMCEYLVGISMGNNMDVCENGGGAPLRVI